jgi:hypothetical protein
VIKRLLWLAAGSMLLWLLAAWPALVWDWWQDDGHLLYSGVAAVICFVPTAATLAWCDIALGKSPEQQLAAVMGGTGIRMLFVIGVGIVLFKNVPEFDSIAFWFWIIGFYLWTLAVEIYLVVGRQSAMDAAAAATGFDKIGLKGERGSPDLRIQR